MSGKGEICSGCSRSFDSLSCNLNGVELSIFVYKKGRVCFFAPNQGETAPMAGGE